MMKMVSAVVMVVLTIVSARACSGGSGSSSPLSPANLVHNGVSALCANQQATAAAGGDTSQAVTLPVPAADQGALARVAGLPAQSFDCTTTTVAAGP